MKLGIVASSVDSGGPAKVAFGVQVDTTKTGLTPNTEVAFGFVGVDNSNTVLINWGDGSTTTATESNTRYTHPYSASGVYDVAFTPVGKITFEEANTDKRKWVKINHWGTNVFQSYSFLCNGATNMANLLTTLPPDFPNADNSMANMFNGAGNAGFGIFRDIPYSTWETANISNLSGAFSNSFALALGNIRIGDLKVSNVTDMSFVFASCTHYGNRLNGWNVGNVSNMRGAFFATDNGQTDAIETIATWNVSNVVDFNSTFANCANWKPNISAWNTINATDMGNMFLNARAFNSNIANWNTSNVTNMGNMLGNTTLFNQPIGNWNTANVANMSRMFANARDFNQPIGNWNTANVANMSRMFSITQTFNRPIGNWKTGNVANMDGMFANAGPFNQNLTQWCVALIPSEPPNFKNSSLSVANLPVWGTCPNP